MGPLGWRELIIIAFIAVLLFGAKRLPDLAKGVGKSIREFKKATSAVDDEEPEKSDAESAAGKGTKKVSSADVGTNN